MERVLNTIHAGACCQAVQDKPKQAITYSWFTSLLLVLIAVIVACVAGNQAGGGSRGVAFAGMWTIILTVALSVGGTLVMRKYQTSMAIGFFLGVVLVMSQQMLIIGAIFGGEASAKEGADDDEANADSAMSVFAFFLGTVYSVFAVLLAVFRNDLIRDETLDADDPALAPSPDEAPPAPV